nr:PREDICTED: uncharacterized protein LOC107078690 [Lepisosteus oculatus]
MPSYDETLRRHSYKLCTSMSLGLVESIASYLYSAQAVTAFECATIRSKPTELEQASQLLSTVVRKGRRACSLFYEALEKCDPFLSARITGSPARVPISGIHRSESAGRPVRYNGIQSLPFSSGQSPPASTSICISHCTLSGCIFGNDNTMSTVRAGSYWDHLYQSCCTEKQEEHPKSCCTSCHKGAERTARGPSAAPAAQSLQMVGSDIEYAIIGDCNVLKVEETEEDSKEQQLPGHNTSTGPDIVHN